MGEIGFWTVAGADLDRIAVVDDQEREIGYGWLMARANQLTHGLAALGLRPGDCVATLLYNQSEFLELALASAQSGTYFLPINWHLTGPEVAHILRDSQAKALIATRRTTPVAVQAAEQAGLNPDALFLVGSDESPSTGSGSDGESMRAVEDLWTGRPAARPANPTAGETMLYTSGTTGRPKGIRRPLTGADPEAAAGPLAQFTSGIFGVPSGPAVQLVTGPLYHATPGGLALCGLHLGHTLVLMDRWEPEEMLRLIERHRVSYLHAVPTMFHRLLSLPERVRDRYDTSSLRSVVHGAAPCPIEVKQRMIDWWGPIITEYYGSSEGGGTYVRSQDWLRRPGTVGLPWPGSRIRILDDDGRDRPPNEPGTVYIKMPGFQFRYHNDDEKTRANTRDGCFTVGDIGYLDDEGYLFLSGRTAELIISGGVNIYPAEIEARLLTHPAVADVGVIGVPNPEWGEEVVAVVQPRDGIAATTDLSRELIEYCRAELAGFKVPRSVVFREQLPRTDAGKLLKHLLRDELRPVVGSG